MKGDSRTVIVEIVPDEKMPVRIRNGENQKFDLVYDMEVLCAALITLISAADKSGVKPEQDSVDACTKAITEGVRIKMFKAKIFK